MDNTPILDMPVISSYSRAEALRDGVLVDVSTTALLVGFSVPVAMTSTVHESYVCLPAPLLGQDEFGRLWDILWMAALAARAQRTETTVRFTVLVRNDDASPSRPVELKLVIGPADDLSPCITILLPDED